MTTIYTIGHSTHSFDELVDILRSHNIDMLVDVRSIPRSRHTPQFNKHSLVQTLPAKNIAYTHLADLGGRRYAHKDSPNQGWHNDSFRGYADYMQTDKFSGGIDELMRLAKNKTIAIMCAEAVPWRCHRSMIADALIVRDIDVQDIYSQTKVAPEKLTSFAQINGTDISYPSDKPQR